MSAAEQVLHRHHSAPVDPLSPDGELLHTCAFLRELQATWQKMWEATSEEPGFHTDADKAFEAWHRALWPGPKLVDRGAEHDPLYRMVVTMPATTETGRQAKAAAVFAAMQAGGYADSRSDINELMAVVTMEAAGGALVAVGEDHWEEDGEA